LLVIPVAHCGLIASSLHQDAQASKVRGTLTVIKNDMNSSGVFITEVEKRKLPSLLYFFKNSK